MPKFAANLSMMFQEIPFLDRFKAASNAGFSAVEFLFPYEFSADDIATRLKDENLRQALFNLPPGDWSKGERGLAVNAERREEFKVGIETALEYAEAIGAPLLHMMAGIADERDEAARKSYEYSLAYAGDKAGERGLRIVIEPINARDMPGYFLGSFEMAIEIIEKLDRPNIGLQFDIYHRQVMRGDVLAALEALMPKIDHIQIASVPRRAEPGTGELDDFRIFSELDRLGYSGYVGCEYRPAAGTLAGLSWLSKTKSL